MSAVVRLRDLTHMLAAACFSMRCACPPRPMLVWQRCNSASVLIPPSVVCMSPCTAGFLEDSCSLHRTLHSAHMRQWGRLWEAGSTGRYSPPGEMS